MEPHLKTRPKKTPFPIAEQRALREKAVAAIKELLLPNNGVKKIVLMGSSVKGTFGKYEPPGFRGSLYSDFDFIVFVDDDYTIPKSLDREPDGKPFPNDELNLAYRQKEFLDNKYDAEIFFVRESSLEDSSTIKLGEQAGIPMTESSEHPYVLIYS